MQRIYTEEGGKALFKGVQPRVMCARHPAAAPPPRLPPSPPSVR